MHDVPNELAPARIQNLLTHVSDIHSIPITPYSNYEQILCHVFLS